MSVIHVGLGSTLVEDPDDSVMKALSFFNPEKGEYENLFTLNEGHNTLATMPGFAKRIIGASGVPRVKDERMPLPDPEIAAFDGLEEVWHEPLKKAITESGGVVSVPEVLGTARTIATILKAFPQERLLDRGTPLSIIVARDSECANALSSELRRLLPNREIDFGGYSDTDDVNIVTYMGLDAVRHKLTGLLIGESLPVRNLAKIVESVSRFRNAARYGILSSAFGGPVETSIVFEGMFGRLSAYVDYDAAVKTGVAVPITVCWVPAPHPNGPVGSGSLKLLEAYAHQENPAFVQMVSEIVQNIPNDLGCLLHAGTVALAKRIKDNVKSLVRYDRHMTQTERRVMRKDIASCSIARVVVTDDYLPSVVGQRVVVAATCQGANFPGRLFPWKKLEHSGERAYIVDFLHDWDVHNGRPGLLRLNDAARAKRYHELGFRQLQVGDIRELPFFG